MCCGRNNTSPAKVPQQQHFATVGNARVPTIQWAWTSVNGVDSQDFTEEPLARAHIAGTAHEGPCLTGKCANGEGNPGTLTPKYI